MSDAILLLDAAGNPYTMVVGVDTTLRFVLDLGGSLTTDSLIGATITGRLVRKRGGAEVIAAQTLSNVDDTNKTADMVLTDVQTADFPANSKIRGDVKVVLADDTERNHGPYEFPTRDAVTP